MCSPIIQQPVIEEIRIFPIYEFAVFLRNIASLYNEVQVFGFGTELAIATLVGFLCVQYYFLRRSAGKTCLPEQLRQTGAELVADRLVTTLVESVIAGALRIAKLGVGLHKLIAKFILDLRLSINLHNRERCIVIGYTLIDISMAKHTEGAYQERIDVTLHHLWTHKVDCRNLHGAIDDLFYRREVSAQTDGIRPTQRHACALYAVVTSASSGSLLIVGRLRRYR